MPRQCNFGEMISVLVLLPWNLNKCCLEVIYSNLHLLEVFLHSFALAFIVTINLTGDYLRVAV